MSRRKAKRNPTKNPLPVSRRRLWCFRLIALVGMPFLFFGVIELGLRLGGFGYPTSFLLKSSNHQENTFVQNDRFGWRFFGPRMARQPFATSIPREKPRDTLRIFVFGESAAYGDPQPRFGLPRMLDAMLSARHPDKKFEVVNAAMTGINSHVIRPLARDCTEAHADVWVIYMGNNEVVGPFGAGTVFGNQAAPLPLIHALLALKTTRTGQLLDSLRSSTQKAAGSGEWEGMRMFVKNKLAETDPRLAADDRNFNKNLKDIIAAGRNSGAKIVLSTVGVNLEDCAPFASLHRSGLSESQLNDWNRLFDAGVQAQQSGDFWQAVTNYDQAKQIDESFAELRFRRAQCALQLKDVAAAQKEFSAARDLDALRFRCDSRLNEIIRQEASGDIALADGEQALAEASPNGIPGADSFYEHVHLTFQGNYVLARAIAEKVEKTLTLSASAPWPDITQCAQRLSYTSRDTQLALSDIRARLKDVPFTFQANHEEQLRHLTEAAHGLPDANSAASLRNAQSITEAALAHWSNDAELWEQLGEIKAREGDYAGAIGALQRSLDLVPSRGSECWLLYGTLLAQEKKYEDAIAAFKRVSEFYSRADWAGHNLALCLEKLGRREEAVGELKRVLARKPDYGTSWLALGQLYEQMGRTNDAEQCYHQALTNRVNQVDDLVRLARFCASRRWFGFAVTNYAAAIEMSPSDPGLRMEAGRALAEFGRRDEAIQQYLAASELTPGQFRPHMQLGFELGLLGKPDLAEQEFRQALRVDTNSIDARVGLGIALYEQKKLDDALKQFDGALERNPKEATALHYAKLLRNRTPPP
jgi:tetratricopeptide (TPR) repeat protein